MNEILSGNLSQIREKSSKMGFKPYARISHIIKIKQLM